MTPRLSAADREALRRQAEDIIARHPPNPLVVHRTTAATILERASPILAVPAHTLLALLQEDKS